MEKLRLLLFEDCDRDCQGCCNKDWDLVNLPVVSDFSQYAEILLTGGEPLLKPILLINTIASIREENPNAKIILYTAKTDQPVMLAYILTKVDGLTITLHEQADFVPFNAFDYFTYDIADKLLRLNIFKGIKLYGCVYPRWQIKDNIKWVKDCPLPQDEIFKRLNPVRS